MVVSKSKNPTYKLKQRRTVNARKNFKGDKEICLPKAEQVLRSKKNIVRNNEMSSEFLCSIVVLYG